MLRTSVVLISLTVPAATVAGAAEPTRHATWPEFWDHWGRMVRAYPPLIWSIIQAPKVVYRIDKLEVYPNGTWAEYAVTNRTGKDIFLDRYQFVGPVRGFSGFDNRGRIWGVPIFRGCILRGPPDEFVLVRSDETIRFRQSLNLLVDKPLERIDVRPGESPGRPKELTYVILGWDHVYFKLPEGLRNPWSNAYVFGRGKVSIKWFDKPYPKDWPAVTRLR